MNESFSHTKTCLICSMEFRTNRPTRQHFCTSDCGVIAQRKKKQIISMLSRGASTTELKHKFGHAFLDYVVRYEEAFLKYRTNLYFDWKDEDKVPKDNNFAIKPEWKLPCPPTVDEEIFDREAYFALVGIKPND